MCMGAKENLTSTKNTSYGFLQTKGGLDSDKCLTTFRAREKLKLVKKVFKGKLGSS